VRAGGGEVGTGAGEAGRDAGGERAEGGQGLGGGGFVADLLAQQLTELAGAVTASKPW
jgi:hypothetical protein